MSKINQLMSTMIGYYKGDTKRINHFLKVYALAKTIGEEERLDEKEQKVLEVAAVVHDIGIKISEEKYGSSSGKYQEIEGPSIAEKMLKTLNFDEGLIQRVCFLVGNHHTYTNIQGMDFQILVEADFLVNIDEENMNAKQIHKIRNNIFKTQTGVRYLEEIYLSIE
ncbi:HD domain-containing protein [Natranaerovirga hydrolytica]|uniref:HD domain-containing protein n=1 Tax=Natranaerovirga hydrolytica TaxID=680378 RepID=A0A4R1MLM2_9FIRM|nr:HD domain-containing protein [Natranaerovirga hydrolytica]TCK92762.1 HD domain-containing protein [Natranaerovirga hydrolytica]